MTIDLSLLYADEGTARLARLNDYVRAVLESVPPGVEVTLTGPAPVWLYLRLAHALHGRVRRLLYASPVVGEMTVFDHTS